MLENLNIVRDCYWAMPSGSRYIHDENGQLSTDQNGLYTKFNANDSEYIRASDSGEIRYYGRLESNNLQVDAIDFIVRAECSPPGSAILSINNKQIGVIDITTGINDYEENFILTNVQKQRIHYGRILDNYDYFDLKLCPSGTLYNVQVSYSGDYTWDNHETGLPNVLTSTYEPTSFSVSVESWSGDVSALDSSEATYIQKTNDGSYDAIWGSDSINLPSGYLSLQFTPSGLSPLTQLTRAKINLNMEIGPSGDNNRDTFEVNGYNNNYYLYGAGQTVESSGFNTYSIELNFLDPNLPSGNMSSTYYRNIDVVDGMNFNLIGVPSGSKIAHAQLQLESIPNTNMSLYTSGFDPPNASGWFDLFLFASSSGTYGIREDVSLFTKSDIDPQHRLSLYTTAGSAETNASLNLYIYPWIERNDSVDLFINGPSGIIGLQPYGQIALTDGDNVLQFASGDVILLQDTSSPPNVCELYVGGYGITDGYITNNSTVPLFMARDSEAVAGNISLVVNNSEVVDMSPMYSYGHALLATTPIVYTSGSPITIKNVSPTAYTTGNSYDPVTISEDDYPYIGHDVPSTSNGWSVGVDANSLIQTSYCGPWGYNPRSIMFWLKFNEEASGTARYLFQSNSITQDGALYLYRTDTGTLLRGRVGRNLTAYGTFDHSIYAPVGDYHHYSLSFYRDGGFGIMKVFVDGTEVISNSIVPGSNDADGINENSFRFKDQYATTYSNYHDIRLYDRYIDSSEIQKIMAGEPTKQDMRAWFLPNATSESPTIYISGSGAPSFSSQQTLYTHGF